MKTRPPYFQSRLRRHLGVAILCWVAAMLVSGLVIHGVRLAWLPYFSTQLLVASHAYLGVVSLIFVVAKVWSSVPGWRVAGPASRGRHPVDDVASVLLLGLYPAIYLSGLSLFLGITPAGGGAHKMVHFWSVLLAVFPTSWHVYRYVSRSVQSVAYSVQRARSGQSRVVGRRALLALAAAAALPLAFRHWVASQIGQINGDPNDFPVTLFEPQPEPFDLATWRLRVVGAVSQPLELSLNDLRSLPFERHTYALDCIQGWSVTREWGGVPVSMLLAKAGADEGYTSLVFRAVSQYSSILARHKAIQAGTMVAMEVGGVLLADEHGYPTRLMAPGVIGETNVKWLREIEVVKPS